MALLSAGLRACISILPWEGHPRAFPGISLSSSPFPEAAWPRMPFPALCLGFILPFLSPLGHILSLWGSASRIWEWGGCISSHTLPVGTIPILLGPREGPWGRQGACEPSSA